MINAWLGPMLLTFSSFEPDPLGDQIRCAGEADLEQFECLARLFIEGQPLRFSRQGVSCDVLASALWRTTDHGYRLYLDVVGPVTVERKTP